MHFHSKILKERNVVSLYHLSNQSAQEKNLSYLFDFRYLKRHIVLWKSSSSLCLLYVICNTKILQSSTSLSIYIFRFFALCIIFRAPDGSLCILHCLEQILVGDPSYLWMSLLSHRALFKEYLSSSTKSIPVLWHPLN